MRKQKFQAIAWGLIISMSVSIAAPAQQIYAEEKPAAVASTGDSYASERIERGYTKVSAGYTLPEYTGEDILYKMRNVCTTENAEFTTEYGYVGNGDDDGAVVIGERGSVELEIEVPESAVYYMNFDYLADSDSILPVEAGIMINGEYPFYEMRQQVLESLWVSDGNKKYDSYGNEVVSIPDKVYNWQNKYVMDSTYRYSEPLGIELQKGKNAITFTLGEGTLLLGNLWLTGKETVAEYTGSEVAAGECIIRIKRRLQLFLLDLLQRIS